MRVQHSGKASPNPAQPASEQVSRVWVKGKGVFGARDDGNQLVRIGTHDHLAENLTRL